VKGEIVAEFLRAVLLSGDLSGKDGSDNEAGLRLTMRGCLLSQIMT
jgi:hypothetical protein